MAINREELILIYKKFLVTAEIKFKYISENRKKSESGHTSLSSDVSLINNSVNNIIRGRIAEHTIYMTNKFISDLENMECYCPVNKYDNVKINNELEKIIKENNKIYE